MTCEGCKASKVGTLRGRWEEGWRRMMMRERDDTRKEGIEHWRGHEENKRDLSTIAARWSVIRRAVGEIERMTGMRGDEEGRRVRRRE